MSHFIAESKMHLRFPVLLVLLSTTAIIAQPPLNPQWSKRSLKKAKSIFIAPLIQFCPRGHIRDEDGNCLRLIRVMEQPSIPTLLDRLRLTFRGQKLKKQQEVVEIKQVPQTTVQVPVRIPGENGKLEKGWKQPHTEDQQPLEHRYEQHPVQEVELRRFQDAKPEEWLEPSHKLELQEKLQDDRGLEDQKLWRRKEDKLRGYLSQPYELEGMPGYHRYIVPNVPREDDLDFVRIQ